MWNHVRAAKMILKRVGIAVSLTASSFLLAAQQDSQSMIAAIKAEGLRGTEATVLFHTLTDTIGPRLTGSPAHVQAARWAVERLKAWGLDNPRLETLSIRARMVPREAYGGDDHAALHAADRICRAMVSSDIRSPDRHAPLHRRQHCCRYRSPRPSPARLHCAHASSIDRVSPQRSAAAIRGNRPGANGEPPTSGAFQFNSDIRHVDPAPRLWGGGRAQSRSHGTRHGARSRLPQHGARRRSNSGASRRALQYARPDGPDRRFATAAHRDRGPVLRE